LRANPACYGLVKPGNFGDVTSSVVPSRRFEQLRVLIADDHLLFAESLRALLCEDDRIEVVGIAENGNEAVRLATHLLPDVVLMDFSMPELDGMAATRRIHDLDLPCRVLLMTGDDDHDVAAHALQAGADGFVRKEQSAGMLLQVFFEVASLSAVLGESDR
jgi:DNA-binding NarL/FixJ family response regulator